MESDLSAGLLDDRDGLNPTRALILQAYYALRRGCTPDRIGCREIGAWIKAHEPKVSFPSDSLIRLTLTHAGLAHRAPGRPRNGNRVPLPPFVLAPRDGSTRRGGGRCAGRSDAAR
jgi:hypothetical protein